MSDGSKATEHPSHVVATLSRRRDGVFECEVENTASVALGHSDSGCDSSRCGSDSESDDCDSRLDGESDVCNSDGGSDGGGVSKHGGSEQSDSCRWGLRLQL
ncbi:hypothetical protein MRX96_024461 [Rhipicephalus microplus]